jgi:hypothetical protein
MSIAPTLPVGLEGDLRVDKGASESDEHRSAAGRFIEAVLDADCPRFLGEIAQLQADVEVRMLDAQNLLIGSERCRRNRQKKGG